MRKFSALAGMSVCALTAAVVAEPIPPAPPGAVPGKEYSDHFDRTAGGVLDPHQNRQWDGGAGGTVDGFDYTGSIPGALLPGEEVDALAHATDFLFDSVTSDASTLLASFTGVGDVHWSASGHHGPAHATPPNVGVWALGPADIDVPPPRDVDGLEIWGVPGENDGNMFSLAGDGGGTSVWFYDDTTHTSIPYISQLDIAIATGRTDLIDQIDLDAMMVDDDGDRLWGPGDRIMFSVAPVAGFDGGEIWVHTFGGGPAPFLFHGGEIWDTAHSVSTHFGLGPDGFENINALESVPTPSSIALFGLAGLVATTRRRPRA